MKPFNSYVYNTIRFKYGHHTKNGNDKIKRCSKCHKLTSLICQQRPTSILACVTDEFVTQNEIVNDSNNCQK